MIAIVVEDGSVVSGANSYVSVEDARTFAANRGVTLSSSNDAVAALLIKANDYLEMFRPRYSGVRTDETQELSWPRDCATVAGEDIESDQIPSQLRAVQNHLVLALNAGFDISPNINSTSLVIEEKVGPLVTKYKADAPTAYMPVVNALLGQLFGGNGYLQCVRG